MKKYILFYGLGGGFGGATNHVVEECASHSDAEDMAWQLAKEIYESHEGMNGLRTINEIMEEEDLCEEEAEEEYNKEVESWLDYRVEEFDPIKHADYEEN